MQTTFFWLLIFLSGVITKHFISNQGMASYPGDQTSLLVTPKDSLNTGIADTKNNHQTTFIVYLAIDHKCGSCHQGTHSTNTKALAIFNLADDCWYCMLTREQAAGIIRRTKGSSFTAEEQEAIKSLMEKPAINTL